MDLIQHIKDMNKVENHIHLDGSISAEWVFRQWQNRGERILRPAHYQNGKPIPYVQEEDRIVKTPAELSAFWGNWTDYAIPDRFGWVTRLMQTREDLTAIAAAHAQELAEQNIIYAETRFAPQYHTGQGLHMEEVIEATLEGLTQGSERARARGNDITMKLIICIGRETDPDVGLDVARAALAYQDHGVVALDLACYEPPFPPEKHAEAFALTFDSGLYRTVHAGEMMQDDEKNLRNIYIALNTLRAHGLGHAIPLCKRYYGETDILDKVRENGVRIESNPISNQFLGFIKHPRDLQLDSLLEQDVLITINSDDPAMWPRGSLADNLYAIAELYGLDAVKQATRNGILSAFGLTEEEKKEYLSKL